MSRKNGKQNSGGVTPPQQGRHDFNGAQNHVVTSGAATTTKVAGYPSMKGIRSGTPPFDPNRSAGLQNKTNAGETHARSGGDPYQGKIIKGTPHDSVKGGAAPTANMSTSAGKAASDLAQNQLDKGRNGFAKGGKIGAKEERTESKAERKAEKKNPALETAEGYAKGGRINRYGADGGNAASGGVNGGTDKNPSGTKAPPTGNNGGLPGGNSPIALGQPGGTPSTGIIASGRMNPANAGADTPQPGGPTIDSGIPKLRSSMVKRSSAGSLPRPRRV